MPVSRHPLLGPVPSLPGVKVDPNASRRLRASLAMIEKAQSDLVGDFYTELLRYFPALRRSIPVGPKDLETQLLGTLKAVVENLHDEPVLHAQLVGMGEYYARLGAKPEHYPIVRAILLDTIAKHGGAGWTTELSAEWAQTLDVMSTTMINAVHPPKTLAGGKTRSV